MSVESTIRRKELGIFLLGAFGNWHAAKMAKKVCYCRVCGLPMFPSIVAGKKFGFNLPESCSCKREFEPSDFTLCPDGALYVSKEIQE